METAGVWWSFIHSARESCREEWSRRDSEMGGEAAGGKTLGAEGAIVIEPHFQLCPCRSPPPFLLFFSPSFLLPFFLLHETVSLKTAPFLSVL